MAGEFPSDKMRVPQLFAGPELAAAVFILIGRPNPARSQLRTFLRDRSILIYLFPKSFDESIICAAGHRASGQVRCYQRHETLHLVALAIISSYWYDARRNKRRFLGLAYLVPILFLPG